MIHGVVFYEDVFSVRMVVLKYIERYGIIWNYHIWNVMYYDIYDERWYIERDGMRYIWNVMVFMECDGI